MALPDAACLSVTLKRPVFVPSFELTTYGHLPVLAGLGLEQILTLNSVPQVERLSSPC